MRQGVLAAIVLAALVQTADAQERKDPPPKPTPRVHVDPRVNIDVRELEERAREMEERVRDLDLTELESRAHEMAERMHDFDFSELEWRAEEMAERFHEKDFSELQWNAEQMSKAAQESFRDMDFDFDFDFDFDSDFDFDFDFDFDAMQYDMHDAAEDMRDAQLDMEMELRTHDWDMSSHMDLQPTIELAMQDAEHNVQRALEGLEWSGTADLADIALGNFGARFESRANGPRPAWAPSDPADSLYRLAREMLNRGNYSRAAALFGEISDRYASSEYAPEALYWQAFALYRIGTTPELERARSVLEAQRARYAEAYARSDGASLAQRIAGALAQRGDRSARDSVKRGADQQPTCDKEDLAVRVEALNALSQLDYSEARPILERVLARHDDCTVGLRKRAVFLIGKQADASAAQILTNVVRSEPDASVRNDAILWLSRVPGEQTVNTLDELLRTSTDERVQRTAVRALAAHDSPRARQIVRATIEREDVPEKLREYAISAIDDDEKTSAEDAAFLRGLYARLTNDRLKRAVIRSVASIDGSENSAWLMALARNNAEPMEMRAEALGRVGRSSDVTINDLVALYETLPSREMRERLITLYSRSKAPEATDKLIDIAKTGTDPRLRRMAISALTRKNDPRTTKLLLEIIEP
jgi:TolA-binding protein